MIYDSIAFFALLRTQPILRTEQPILRIEINCVTLPRWQLFRFCDGRLINNYDIINNTHNVSFMYKIVNPFKKKSNLIKWMKFKD